MKLMASETDAPKKQKKKSLPLSATAKSNNKNTYTGARCGEAKYCLVALLMSMKVTCALAHL
jgi:hypothetical protein